MEDYKSLFMGGAKIEVDAAMGGERTEAIYDAIRLSAAERRVVYLTFNDKKYKVDYHDLMKYVIGKSSRGRKSG